MNRMSTMATRTLSVRGIASAGLAAAVTAGAALTSQAEAAFVGYVVTVTPVTNSGQSLLRYEVFAVFNGPTDTVLNVFNFQAQGGWGAHLDAASGFWHKDNSDYSGGVLGQQYGTWAPQLTGSATANRPFDSFLVIGGTATATNSSNADPSWCKAGTAAASWGVAQIPVVNISNANTLGWFNSSPPNNQGRVGNSPAGGSVANGWTQLVPIGGVRVMQFVLSESDTAFRTYSLRTAYNNGAGGSVVFVDGTFTLCKPAQTSTYYRDLDGDGVGSVNSGIIQSCPPAPGHVSIGGDCNDSDATVTTTTWYSDLDGDGFGAAASGTQSACTQPAGYVLNNLDCNDGNAALNPNTVWYRDLDGDGFGVVADGTQTQCAQPAGYALQGADNCPAIANPTQTDCDGDGIGDACDSTGNADCNSNGVPDLCDLAAGTSTDLNGNGIPDECSGEFVVGGSGYANVQAAINAAPDGATIRVAGGTYGPVDLTSRSLVLRSIGGAAATVIDGGGNSRCLTIGSPGTGFIELDGFTFRNGSANNGGALSLVLAGPVVRNCVFADNTAMQDGGAVVAFGAAPRFFDCVFAGNTALQGGAVALVGDPDAGDGFARFERCTFDQNESLGAGGAIYNDGAVDVIDCVIDANLAGALGGGVFTIGSSPTRVLNTLFCRNLPTNTWGTYTDLGGNTFSGDCDANGVCDAEDIESGAPDQNGNDVLDSCELARGDLNLDGEVAAADLALLLSYWGQVNPPVGDLTGDGVVNASDLSEMLANWGSVP